VQARYPCTVQGHRFLGRRARVIRIPSVHHHQSSEWDHALILEPLDLNQSSPESGDLQCQQQVSKTAIRLHSEGSLKHIAAHNSFETGVAALRVDSLGLRVKGFGSRAPGSEFQVSGSGFRVLGSVFRVSGLEFRVPGFGFQFQGAPDVAHVPWMYHVSGSGFGCRVPCLGSGFQFQGAPGLVFQAHRLLCHSNLGSSVIKKKRRGCTRRGARALDVPRVLGSGFQAFGSGFRVSGVGFRVPGFGCRAQCGYLGSQGI